MNDQLSNKSGRKTLIFSFCFAKTRNLKWRYALQKKKAQMRSFVERRKLQRCLACYMKSIINLSRRLLKEACWTSQLAMSVWQKFKTLCWLSNWIQRRIQKNAGSVERRGELRRSKRKLQSIIKVSFWRLYNVYNQQDQTFVINNLVVDKAQPAWYTASSMIFPFFHLVSKSSRWEMRLLKTGQ